MGGTRIAARSRENSRRQTSASQEEALAEPTSTDMTLDCSLYRTVRIAFLLFKPVRQQSWGTAVRLTREPPGCCTKACLNAEAQPVSPCWRQPPDPLCIHSVNYALIVFWIKNQLDSKSNCNLENRKRWEFQTIFDF